MPVSYASGNGKNLDAASTSPAQGAGAFMYRASCGHHIINEQDRFSPKHLRQGHGKTVLKIVAALLTREMGLRRGGVKSLEEIKTKQMLPLRKAGTGQKDGLIEAAVSQPRGMERNRHHDIRCGEVMDTGRLLAERLQRLQSTEVACKFQPENNFADRSFVKKERTGQIKIVFPLQAEATEMVDTRGVRGATTGAKR